MKRSLLVTPESSKYPRAAMLAAHAGALARKLVDRSRGDEPASERAMQVALFLKERAALNRFIFVSITSAGPSGTDSAAPSYSRDAFQDKPYARLDDPGAFLPQASIRLYGRHYLDTRPRPDRDVFACKFNVFTLEANKRLVQAAPIKATGPAFGDDNTLTKGVLHELFGPEYDPRLEAYRNLTLGTLDENATFQQAKERPLCPRPFGVDILPVLDHISQPAQHDLHLQITGGYVYDYAP